MDNMSPASGKEEAIAISKVKERPGNVIENKGTAFSSAERSGNFTENKRSYALKSEMLLKGKKVGGSS